MSESREIRTGVFIGRFQPFHDGHHACIEHVLRENDQCIVLVRDGHPDERNPFTYEEIAKTIWSIFKDTNRVSVHRLPDPDHQLTVYLGRDVGYELIRLDPSIEGIRATDLRATLSVSSSHPDQNDPALD